MTLNRPFFLRLGKRLALGALGALALYTLLGFVVIPRVARSVLEKKLTELLHRPVSIRKVSLNPYSLALTVDGFSIGGRDGGPFVAFEQLSLDLQAASILKGGVIVRSIVLREPSVTVVRETATTYNFTDLLEQFSSPEDPPPPPSKPIRYSLNNLRVVGGSVDFVDRPKDKTHTVRGLNVSVPFLSTLPYDLESYVQPSFEATVNGTPFSLAGRTKPFSETRETSFDIDIEDLSIPQYMEYVPVALRFAVPTGIFEARVSFSYDQPADRAPGLSISGHLAVKDLAAVELGGKPIAKLRLLDVTLAPSDVLGGKLVVDKVRLERPELHVHRDASGRVNLASLGPAPAKATTTGAPAASATSPAPATTADPGAGPSPAADAAPAFLLEINDTRLVDGTVYFGDSAPGGAFETTLAGLEVGVTHFSTAPGKSAGVDVRVHTEAGELIHEQSEVTLSPLRVTGRLEVTGLVLPKYAPYYAPSVLVDLDDGKLDLDARFELDLDRKTPRVAIPSLGVSVSALRLHKRGEKRELFGLESFTVQDASLDLDKRALVLGSVGAHKGRLQVDRAANGTVNLTTLVPPPAPGRRVAPAAPAAPVDEHPWSLQLGKLALDDWSIRVEDRVPERPVTITAQQLGLTVENFSLARGTRFNVNLRSRVNKGNVAVSGSLVLDPLAATLKLSAGDLDLLVFQPYFTDRINLLLTSGAFSGKGDFTLAPGPDRAPRVTYKGEARIDKLATVDKKSSEDFLKWATFDLRGLDVSTEPTRVAISAVVIDGFYSRLAINPDASLNLRGILVEDAPGAAPPGGVTASPGSSGAPPSPPSPPAPAPAAPAASAGAVASAPAAPEAATVPITINEVTLQGGTIDFTDRLVKPNYSASLKAVTGKLSHLSSDPTAKAEFSLEGKLGDYAPLEITGTGQLLAKKLDNLEVKVKFSEIDLSLFSPYSGKYAGYTISKGKLYLDLRYAIAGRKLEATNTVFIDQLTFGDSVDSPSATKLPVRLAVALLKDRKGEIHLGLPVGGSLDDPKVSLGGVILDAIENLLIKAATAPFALLGSLFGSGEDLSFIEFDEGRANLDPGDLAKLTSLAKALNDRPALKLDITGHVDPTRDREGMRRVLFERKLKSQKVKDLTEQGVTVPESVDDLKLDAAEYARYLELAYKQETFPKPRNVLGIAKDLPGPEMEKLMLTHLTVSDDDLHSLAEQRAQGVKEQLSRAKIDMERIFVVETKSIATSPNGKVKASRVDFLLK